MKKKTFMSKKDIEKEFKSGIIELTRLDYLDLTCPLWAMEIDDKAMQKIADEINAEMTNLYSKEQFDLLERYYDMPPKTITDEIQQLADEMISMQFELFEKVARENGMRYLDDIDNPKESEMICNFIQSLPY